MGPAFVDKDAFAKHVTMMLQRPDRHAIEPV
jgi:hypothetical protein